jgi:hypothetical protein
MTSFDKMLMFIYSVFDPLNLSKGYLFLESAILPHMHECNGVNCSFWGNCASGYDAINPSLISGNLILKKF